MNKHLKRNHNLNLWLKSRGQLLNMRISMSIGECEWFMKVKVCVCVLWGVLLYYGRVTMGLSLWSCHHEVIIGNFCALQDWSWTSGMSTRSGPHPPSLSVFLYFLYLCRTSSGHQLGKFVMSTEKKSSFVPVLSYFINGFL